MRGNSARLVSFTSKLTNEIFNIVGASTISIPWIFCDEDVLDDSYRGGLKTVLPTFRVEATINIFHARSCKKIMKGGRNWTLFAELYKFIDVARSSSALSSRLEELFLSRKGSFYKSPTDAP